MQITIDTNKDSPAEIKKAIELLSSLANSRVHSNTDVFSNDNSIPSSSQSSTEGGMFNMFNNNENNSQLIQQTKQQSEETPKVEILKY